MLCQKRIDRFEQTMKELKAVRKRAAAAGLSRKFSAKWENLVRGCWDGGHRVEDMSPLKVYESII